MPTMKQAAAEFLAGKRVAVTGVSRKPQGHGSNAVYQRLRQRGYQVFAVNPNADRPGGWPGQGVRGWRASMRSGQRITLWCGRTTPAEAVLGSWAETTRGGGSDVSDQV
jgi:CoA binding domain